MKESINDINNEIAINLFLTFVIISLLFFVFMCQYYPTKISAKKSYKTLLRLKMNIVHRRIPPVT